MSKIDNFDIYQASHEYSVRQHGVFYYNGGKVIGYGLINGGGGETTIFSFLLQNHADSFAKMLYDNGCYGAMVNCAQVICIGDYKEVMEFVDKDQIIYCTFSYGMM